MIKRKILKSHYRCFYLSLILRILIISGTLILSGCLLGACGFHDHTNSLHGISAKTQSNSPDLSLENLKDHQLISSIPIVNDQNSLNYLDHFFVTVDNHDLLNSNLFNSIYHSDIILSDHSTQESFLLNTDNVITDTSYAALSIPSLYYPLSSLYLLQIGNIYKKVWYFLSSYSGKILIGSIAFVWLGSKLYSTLFQPPIDYFTKENNLVTQKLEHWSYALEQLNYRSYATKNLKPNDVPPFLFIDQEHESENKDEEEDYDDDPFYVNYSHNPINLENITSNIDLSQTFNTLWTNLTDKQLVEYIARIAKNEITVFDNEKIQWITKEHVESFIMSLSDYDKDIFLGLVLKLGEIYILDFAKIYSIVDFDDTLALAKQRDYLKGQFIDFINYYFSNIINLYPLTKTNSKDLSKKSILNILEEKFQTISEKIVIDKLLDCDYFSDYDLNNQQKYPNFNYQTLKNFIHQSKPLQRYLTYAYLLQMLPKQSQQLQKNPLQYRVLHHNLADLTKKLINLFSGIESFNLTDNHQSLKTRDSQYKTLEEMESMFLNLDSSEALELVLTSSIFPHQRLHAQIKKSWNQLYELLIELINNSSDLNRHILYSVFFNLDDSTVDDLAKIHQLSKPQIQFYKKELVENIFHTFFPHSTINDDEQFLQAKNLKHTMTLIELIDHFKSLDNSTALKKLTDSPYF